MKIAAVAISAAEIAQLVQVAASLATLLQKIQISAPDVWKEVETDYAGALAAWSQAPAAPQAITVPISQEVASIVNAAGKLENPPIGHTDAGVIPPAETLTEMPQGQGADALPAGTHIQAPTSGA